MHSLERTWPLLRAGKLPDPGEMLPVYLTEAQAGMASVNAAGGPARAPYDYATALLAFAHVHRATPSTVPEYFRRILAPEEAPENSRKAWRSGSVELFKQARQHRQLRCLDAALILADAALRGEVAGHDFMMLGSKFRFELSGDPEDHDEVVRHARAALTATPDDAPELPGGFGKWGPRSPRGRHDCGTRPPSRKRFPYCDARWPRSNPPTRCTPRSGPIWSERSCSAPRGRPASTN